MPTLFDLELLINCIDRLILFKSNRNLTVAVGVL